MRELSRELCCKAVIGNVDAVVEARELRRYIDMGHVSINWTQPNFGRNEQCSVFKLIRYVRRGEQKWLAPKLTEYGRADLNHSLRYLRF